MGYSGYEIMMDSNGHYTLRDADCWDDEECKCDHCDEDLKPVASVDTTNCLPYYLDFELHQLTPMIRHRCPVCNKVHETTEETYEFKQVDMYESEDGNFIKTKLKPVDRVMSQPCSEFCKKHLAMEESIARMLKQDSSLKVHVDIAFTRYGIEYEPSK